MSAIRGTIQGGRVILDEPTGLPDGTPVVVCEATEGEYVGVGMREEDWPTDEAGIAALVASMDQIQPFLTPEEEVEWQKARSEQKAWELANWERNWKKLEGLFE